MAKPTTESIALPEFAVTIVRCIDGHMIHDEIVLKDLFSQNSHRQHGLILYFYPRDNTPGCTTQATEFSARLSEFLALGYDIIGVSRDSVSSHEKFISKYDLHIPLISDTDETLCKHFDVIKEKTLYGKKTLGLVRSTFVFDAHGSLTHAQRNLRAKGYADRLLDSLST